MGVELHMGVEFIWVLSCFSHSNTDRTERAGVGTIGKQHFTASYSLAREVAFTKTHMGGVKLACSRSTQIEC